MDKLLSQGLATVHELEHLSSLITTVYDLSVVFCIGNALCESCVLHQEELAIAYAKAFEHTIEGKLIESPRSAGFFSVMLDHCVRNRLITREDYTNCKSKANESLLIQQDFERTTRVKAEVHELRWQLSMNKERIPKLQAQIKHVARAYQFHRCRLICAFEFIAVARMFVESPVFRYCFDHGINLASPAELLGATVNYSSVDTFMDSDWNEVVLTCAAVAVLEKAVIFFYSMTEAQTPSKPRYPVKLSDV